MAAPEIHHKCPSNDSRNTASNLHVYLGKKLIVIETNIAWALPYWGKRKQLNNSINWKEMACQ